MRIQSPASSRDRRGVAVTHEQQKIVEDLFERHSRGVGSFVLARVGDAELAEELTSRVFAAVAGAVAQCHGPPAAWLWAIVRNELAMHFREQRPMQELNDRQRDPREMPDQHAEQTEMRQRMAEAIARLPDDLQQILWMKFYEDMPNTEIAEATSLPPRRLRICGRPHRGS